MSKGYSNTKHMTTDDMLMRPYWRGLLLEVADSKYGWTVETSDPSFPNLEVLRERGLIWVVYIGPVSNVYRLTVEGKDLLA